MRDIQRTFEISGVAGGQRAFHYYADTIDKVLYLQDKNVMALRSPTINASAPDETKKPDEWISKTAWAHIGNEKEMIDRRAWSTRREREFSEKPKEIKRKRMVLHYDTQDGSQVVLTGLNEYNDSVTIVLNRYDRKYVLPKSSLNAGKY